MLVTHSIIFSPEAVLEKASPRLLFCIIGNYSFPIIQKQNLTVRAKFSAKGGNAHGQTKRECYDRREASGAAALFYTENHAMVAWFDRD